MQVPPRQEIMVNIRDPECVSLYKCNIRALKICDAVFHGLDTSVAVDSLGALYKGWPPFSGGGIIVLHFYS